MSGQQRIESEKQTLREQLEASKRVIDAARRESQCLEKQVEELERKLQSSQAETQAAEGRLQRFLNKMVTVLQRDSKNTILPTESDILLNMDELCNKVSG